MLMANPSHPGEILREDVFSELDVSITDAAKSLGVSRVALSRVLNCKASVSTDLAIRLEQAGIGVAETWLTMQTNYDLAQARKRPKPEVKILFHAMA